MDGGEDGNGLFGDVDTREDSRSLGDTGETLVEDLCGQMAELEVDVVLLGTNTAAFADLDGHRTRYDVAGREILRGRRVTLHESLALRVEQVATLATRT